MENTIEMVLHINEKFDSLYKLGYFLIDFNSICNFTCKINEQNIEESKKDKRYTFGITTRRLNKNSIESFHLLDFRQGSFVATVVVPIIVGVIIGVIVEYINSKIRDVRQNQPKIEIHFHGDNNTINNYVVNNYDKKKPLEENIANVVKELYENRVIENCGLLYDENGRKIIAKNVERLKGQLIDKLW
jgi:uncharacterized membrane protein YraQ (UPF0718 family)